MNLVFKWIQSPVGPLKLVGHDAGLAAILWENDNPRRVRLGAQAEDSDHSALVTAEQQLTEYFQGVRISRFRSPSPARPSK
jgi:methylated-DNA-[protein]-cysteine S-methyltransferase